MMLKLLFNCARAKGLLSLCARVRYNDGPGFFQNSQWRESMSDQNDTATVVINNGPYRVMGDNIIIKDAAGNTFGLAGRSVVSLCRCGHSENKPFCDGSHARVGFQSEVQARELPPPVPKL
jgi:CDGSH-type Zn-finger protein